MFTASVHQSQRTAQLTNKFIHSRWEFPIPWKTVTPRRYHLNRRNSFLWMWHWCYDFPQLPAYFSCRLCTKDQKVNAHHYHTDNKQNAEKKILWHCQKKKKGRKTDGCAHTLLDLFKNTNTEFVQNILLQNSQTFPKTNRPSSPTKLALLSYTHTTGTLSRHATLNQIQKGFQIKSFSYFHLITHCWPSQFFTNPLLQIICRPLLSNSELSKTLAKVPFSPISTAWKTLIPQTWHIF